MYDPWPPEEPDYGPWELPEHTASVTYVLHGVGSLEQVGDPPALVPLLPSGYVIGGAFGVYLLGVNVGSFDCALLWVNGCWKQSSGGGYVDPPYPGLLPPPPSAPSEPYPTAGVTVRYVDGLFLNPREVCYFGSWGPKGPWCDRPIEPTVTVTWKVEFGALPIVIQATECGEEYRFQGTQRVTVWAEGGQTDDLTINTAVLQDLSWAGAFSSYPVTGAVGGLISAKVQYPWSGFPLLPVAQWCYVGQPSGFDFDIATNPNPALPWGAGENICGFQSVTLRTGLAGHTASNLSGGSYNPGIVAGKDVVILPPLCNCHNNGGKSCKTGTNGGN